MAVCLSIRLSQVSDISIVETMLHNSPGTHFMKSNILMKFQSVTTNWGAKYTWGKEKFANFDK